ncbi:hypothetical protein BDR22DRAFT_825811 [Usnea florida]
MDGKSREPERSLEDQIIASFLKEHSSVYCDMRDISATVSSDPVASVHFNMERNIADHSTHKDQKRHFNIMKRIGDEMQRETRALSLQHPRAEVLDLCMAPGGYTASVCKYSPQAHVSAITLPECQGGHHVFVRHGSGTRVEVMQADITRFAAEFGVTENPTDSQLDPAIFSSERPFPKPFDLIFCDGHVARTQDMLSHSRATEASRLICSQLIIAMERIKSGGTIIVLLHKADYYDNVKLIRLFDKISRLQLFKPVKGHGKKSSFYLVAKDMQPGRRVAQAAVSTWKQIWKDATFSSTAAPTGDGNHAQDEAEVLLKHAEREKDSHELVGSFGERLIELAEPLWETQRNALQTLMERLKNKSAASSLDRNFRSPKAQVNTSSLNPNGQIKDSNSLSQLDVSVASNSEEGASAGDRAVGGQQQEDLHEGLDTRLTHAAVGLAGSDQVPENLVETARTKTLDDTRALPTEFGKSPSGSSDIFTTFEELTDGQQFLRLDD